MGKNLKAQFLCIIAVAVLTIYNILPTVVYYWKPMQEQVDSADCKEIIQQITSRLQSQETESIDWVQSFCQLIDVKAKNISLKANDAEWIQVDFSNKEDAQKFSSSVQRSGLLIPFDPQKLIIANSYDEKTVLLQRQIPVQTLKIQNLFSHVSKKDFTFQEWVIDRASQVITSLCNEPKDKIKAMLRQDSGYKFINPDANFSHLLIDFEKEKICLFKSENCDDESEKIVLDVSKITKNTGQTIVATNYGIEIPFFGLDATNSILTLDLDSLANLYADQVVQNLKTKWKPEHPDLQNITICRLHDYEYLSPLNKALSIVVVTSFEKEGASAQSLNIIAKGIDALANAYQGKFETPQAKALGSDLKALFTLLERSGFAVGNKNNPLAKELNGDFLFEKRNFADSLIQASRENFKIYGSQKFAILELSTKEQRAIVENKIDTQMHNELITWRDTYLSNQVNPHLAVRFETPKPTKNVFLNNILVSFRKIFRGDEQKIIRWGLDLSGGKSVEIELQDKNRVAVNTDSDLKQGMNELYTRVNKMGLSEVAIRQVGHHIVLDFPGSQSLSGQDLIKSSSMHLHVVNEKFSQFSPNLADIVNRFLQRVWDEAVFTGKIDSQSVHKIALKHLYDKNVDSSIQEDAKVLKDQGLVLAKETGSFSENLDDRLSKIAIQRGSSIQDWQGFSHPLMIVFNTPVLDGSHLKNIYSSYDPSRGNYLSFEVSSTVANQNTSINPQNALHNWTQKYSKDGVLGTNLENYSHSRGWRMAVILNDTIISSPTLDSPLKTGGMISGKFTQSEVQHLCADLKAGSMTFVPHILSEKNVSPELGKGDRLKGITATASALLVVIVCMIGYYRFAGVIASIAVLFNLIIMWAVLQNLGATLTLAGIAGIILTVGMSIDANVLVFERMKEEFAITQKIQSAIQEGYKKAFSAIVDSNITTIIAALILLNFDAGPMKSFATNLIIGIVSSMFTALFVTKVYFTYWAKNPKNTTLTMANWIQTSSFDFLAQTKKSIQMALAIIVLGLGCMAIKSSSILGLDFAGGNCLTVELEKVNNCSYTDVVKNALINAGAHPSDFQVQELSPSNCLRILLSHNMEQPQKPFYQMPFENADKANKFIFEKNPKIVWVVDALQKANISVSESSLKRLHQDFSSVSGQMSDSMKTHAIFGFLLSFVGIFIYLAIRFEYKFAAAAVICLIHDGLITLACMGLAHFMQIPVQLDLITIAALMTAVGYSLNDTIIIFDRIREEMMMHPQRNIKTIINQALNATLSRTLITSGSTFLVLLALLVLGGSSIFGFAFVMTVGVVFGTISSWFIAAPLMLYFHSREEKQAKTA